MDEFYNNYYITIDANSSIISGWSSGPFPDRATTDAICINEQGSYQFRLHPEGEENPPLYTIDGIPLYKRDGAQVISRTDAEITADRAMIQEPPKAPTAAERLDALESAMLSMMGGMANV